MAPILYCSGGPAVELWYIDCVLQGDRVTDILLKSSRHHNCSDLTSLREELVCVVKMSRQNAIKMGKVSQFKQAGCQTNRLNIRSVYCRF